MKMANKFRFVVLFLTVASVAVLTACGAATPAAPTADPNAIYTQAVMTVNAGLTQTAAARPSDTPTPEPTATTAPTETVEPSVTPTQEAVSGTAFPTLPQPGQAAQPTAKPGSLPLATTAALGQAGDHASFGSQSPADNSHFNGGVQAKVFWSLVNTGTTTWNKSYTLKWVGGTQLSGQTSIKLDRDVAPGKKGEFYTILIAPTKNGTFVSYWKLYNASGQIVPGSEVYLKFIVP